MKGILLAGGYGTRLYPITKGINKHLIPIYDKPMIYYPLSILMLANIQDILIISTPEDLPKFQLLLRDGFQLGLKLSYKEQPKPEGIAQAFIIGKDFIENDSVCLILGDNIFYGHGLTDVLKKATQLKQGGLIFGYWVKDSQRYGVVEFDTDGNVIGIEEKPKEPKSNYAIPGLYFFDSKVCDIASELKPSKRNELEITDIIRKYLDLNELKVEILGRGFAWLDTGTPESLFEASMFIQTIEKRQGLKIACLEEIAYRMGFIDRYELISIINSIPEGDYKDHLYYSVLLERKWLA